MVNYNSYLKSSDSLSFKEATEIYEKMTTQMDMSDVDDAELWNDLLNVIKEYSDYRFNWYGWDMQKRNEMDKSRSMCHDDVITHFNMISRVQENQGKDNSWRKQLGDARKRIGDFACYIMYIVTINMR
ncbi:MAG: hypothetical protein IJB96_11890 [Lachnospira sp.]|nr:hypothetical protein [Lachnospira sp.]